MIPFLPMGEETEEHEEQVKIVVIDDQDID
jgi:hypothetical protein